jgi:hypothetical protein
VVVFEDRIQCFGQNIPFEDIKKIEIETDEIVIYLKNTEKWILLRSARFKAETWNRLTERLKKVNM